MLSSLGSSTWGVRLQDMRRLYEAIGLLQMMYACSIWSNANLNDKKRCYTYKTIDALRSIQGAARSICGAYRATLSAALDVETESSRGLYAMSHARRYLLLSTRTTGYTKACGRKPTKP
jgi:hypothetical protein